MGDWGRIYISRERVPREDGGGRVVVWMGWGDDRFFVCLFVCLFVYIYMCVCDWEVEIGDGT